MRISDADRAEVADRLSRHYGDGRLDQAEFNERLDQAMRAKTRSDLDGLFADLPDTDVPSALPPKQDVPPVPPRHLGRRPRHRIAFIALVVVAAAVTGHALTQFYVPWLWIGLLVFLVLRYGPVPRRRR
jgi:hypothetical protein